MAPLQAPVPEIPHLETNLFSLKDDFLKLLVGQQMSFFLNSARCVWLVYEDKGGLLGLGRGMHSTE